MDEIWKVYGLHIDGIWIAYRWYMIGILMVYDWYLDGSYIISIFQYLFLAKAFFLDALIKVFKMRSLYRNV